MGSRKLTKILFAIYFIAITWIIVFKMAFSLHSLDYARSINLIPFAASAIANNTMDISEIIWNALIFLPFGMYVGLLLRNRPFGKKLLLFAGTSLIYEALQYILAIGRSDITDLISNCLGGVMGLVLYGLVARLCKTQARTVKLVNTCALVGTLCAAALLGTLLIVNT